MTAEVADRQERRKRRTRQAIQAAALELFAERGYRDTTINDIAERADVAPRTVTVHFPAKEELLFDADPFTLDSLSERLATRPPHESALEALRDWMAATIQRLRPPGPSWTDASGNCALCAHASSPASPSFAAAPAPATTPSSAFWPRLLAEISASRQTASSRASRRCPPWPACVSSTRAMKPRPWQRRRALPNCSSSWTR